MPPLPFAALLPIEGRILLLDYEPFLPLCVSDVSGSDNAQLPPAED